MATSYKFLVYGYPGPQGSKRFVGIGKHTKKGILIEQSDRHFGRLVIGIGLNINTVFDSAPEELRQIATSMRVESQRTFDPYDVLVQFLRRWDFNIAQPMPLLLSLAGLVLLLACANAFMHPGRWWLIALLGLIFPLLLLLSCAETD